MEAPPLPALISLQENILSTNQHNEEIQFEEAQLICIYGKQAQAPSSQSFIESSTISYPKHKSSIMDHHHIPHLRIYEKDEYPKWHWFI